MNIDTHNARMKTSLNNAHRRGSAVVIVTVTLVIMVLLGMAYLQTAQVQRFASFDDQGDMDTQIDAIIAQIRQVLKDDLTDPGATGPTENEFEPYDHAWTNQDSNWEVTLFDGSNASARGNDRDDVWLAALMPDFDVDEWPHLTNLNGIFLNYDNSSNDFTLASGVPEEHVVDFSDPDLNSDTGLDLDSTQLVDADGDGIEDSRWTWAPIKTINGVTYVMAVRIVDLSGKVNVNIAQSLIDETGAYDESTDAPRWTHPAELDIGRFVLDGSATGSASTHMPELQDSLEYRFNDTLPTPSDDPLVPLTWRNGFWNEQGRFADAQDTPTPGYSLYSRADAYELLRRNGLNQDPATGETTTIEQDGDGMDDFLRATAAETVFNEVDVTLYSDTATSPPSRQEFFELEPRHQMTPLSGAAIFAATVPGTTFNADSIKTDLNDADAAEIATIVDNVFTGASTMPGGGTAADFANQFTANIIDYRDTDNELTVLDPGGDKVYGMEALPAIAEVYVQRHYSTLSSDTNSANTNLFDVEWQEDGQAGYAIEIRNPFPHEISLENVNVIVGGNDWGALDALAGQTTLGAHEELILYRDSVGGSGGNDDVNALYSSPDNENEIDQTWPGDAWTTDTTAGTSQQPETTEIEIELQATDDNGDLVTYVKATSVSMPDQYTQVRVGDDTSSPDEGHWQRSDLGNGEKINSLLIAASEFAGTDRPTTESYNDSMGALTEETKGGPARKIDPADAEQLLIADREFAHIGELAHIAAIGPTDTETIPEVFGSATSFNGFRLDFTASTMDSDNYDVPHAVFLIDQFTTLSPRTDGVDNDGDNTIDNDTENMVRGTINLNTAPQHLLEKVLPIPDQDLRQDVAAAIVAYRENPNRGSNLEGIAYVGELMMNNVITGTALPSGVNAPGEDSADTRDLNGTVIDFLNNPNATTGDGIIDDREEQAMLAKWLSQVGSTRSDYFAAYVTVRGYSDFSGPPDEAARFIAIFERNAANGEVEVKALLPGSDPYMVK